MTRIDGSWYERPPDVGERTGAGGVVIRRDGDRLLVGLVQEDGFPEYILPKGRLEPGEDIETAARREIAEEAGLTGLRLLGKLGVRERLDFRRRQWVTTHYFLYWCDDPASAPTDVEHEYRLHWFPLDELPAMFWPEQWELLESNRDRIASTAPPGSMRKWRVEPITVELWPDLVELFGPRGASGGCWCMWWRLPNADFVRGKGDGNRNALESLVRAGTVPGLLAYHGERAVGWCSLGPREEFPRLARSRILKPVDDAPVWSVVCFFVDRHYRGGGVTSTLLESAKEYARRQGASILEGYPVDAGDRRVVPAFAYTGLASTFAKAGFVEVARRSPTRPIMRCDLTAKGEAETGPADPRRVFGERAAYYTTSPVHRDGQALADLVAMAQPRTDWTVLDVATGSGHTALAFAPYVRRVLALDLTPQMLGEARALSAEAGAANVAFGLADAHRLPLASGSADLVTCRRAAHHFRDLTAFLSEAHRVLRPGSLLLVEDRSVLEDPWVDRIMNQLDRLHDPSHVREYRPSEWRTALEHAGFTVLRLELRERLRPLSSLTDNASPAAASEIRAIFARLSEEERSALSAVGSGESSRSNHWYITVLAERA
mgnify:FL=1